MPRITGQVIKEITYVPAILEVLEQVAIPRWITRNQGCDDCQFDFEDADKFITAIRTERGTLFMHQQCAVKAIQP